MNKCEWKDGIYKACCQHMRSESNRSGYYYCPFCGVLVDELPPSHEEIMTLWWEILDDCWQKVDTVTIGENQTFYVFNGHTFETEMNDYNRSCVNADWFIGKNSATIPPEKI